MSGAADYERKVHQNAEMITRQDTDPLSQAVWAAWDTGRPVVVNVNDDGSTTQRFLDEKFPEPQHQPWWKRIFR